MRSAPEGFINFNKNENGRFSSLPSYTLRSSVDDVQMQTQVLFRHRGRHSQHYGSSPASLPQWLIFSGSDGGASPFGADTL